MEIPSANLQKVLADRKLRLEVTPEVKEKILAEGYDPQYGARPMRRAIQRLIQDPLALRLLEGDFVEGDTVEAALGENGAIVFSKTAAPVEEPVGV